MTRLALALALAAAATASPVATEFLQAVPAIVIDNVTVIDGSGGAPIRAASVVVVGSRITAVGRTGKVRIPRGARRIDGTGRFLIPGLWEMHAHLSKVRGSALSLFLANGVTSVRDMGGELAEVRGWQGEIRRGVRVGPRIVTAGPYLESASNVLRARLEGQIEPTERIRIGIGSPAAASRLVDSVARLGVDFLKIRTVENPETYRAIAAAARRNKLALVGHPFGIPIPDLIAARQRSVEHFLPLGRRTVEERSAIYRSMVDSGIAIVPTLATWHHSLFVVERDAARIVGDSLGALEPRMRFVSAFLRADWEEQLPERDPETVKEWRDAYPNVIRDLREMRAAGVSILPGADVAVVLIFPGYSLHDELSLFVSEAGMTPMEALVSATRGSAAFMGLADSVGTISVGKVADLVLLEADPLEDVRNTRRIVGVVAGGTYRDRAALDAVLAAVPAMPDVQQRDWFSGDQLPDSLRSAYAALTGSTSAELVARAIRVLTSMADPEGDVKRFLDQRVNAAGQRLLRGGDARAAAAVYRLNLGRGAAMTATWLGLSDALLAAGDTAGAVRGYREVIAIDAHNEVAVRRIRELAPAPSPKATASPLR